MNLESLNINHFTARFVNAIVKYYFLKNIFKKNSGYTGLINKLIDLMIYWTSRIKNLIKEEKLRRRERKRGTKREWN